MQQRQAPVRVVVVYYSRFGVVEQLARHVTEGARRVEGVDVELLEVEDQPIEELRPGETETAMALRRAAVVNQLAEADALVVGAPGYFGSMASPMKRFFEDCATSSSPPATDRTRPWRHHLFYNKVGAAFTSTGTPHGGSEETLHSILTMFMHLGMIIVTPGQQPPILVDESAPYGATAISGPEGDRLPTTEEQEAARNLGQQVAEQATWFGLGYAEWARLRDLRRRQAARGAERPF